MDSINVSHGERGGMDVQLGAEVLWVESQAHWEDIAARVRGCFVDLGPRRGPLARKDNVKPTDYSSVNCSGACYSGDDE